MGIVTGVAPVVRVMLIACAAIAPENLALRHQPGVLRAPLSVRGYAGETDSSECGPPSFGQAQRRA